MRKGDRRPGCLVSRRTPIASGAWSDHRFHCNGHADGWTGVDGQAPLGTVARSVAPAVWTFACWWWEDDDQVATVLAALLESEGYEVALATTAEAGLARLRERPFHHAICLLDYDVDQPRLDRTIRVLKMRGSAHSARSAG